MTEMEMEVVPKSKSECCGCSICSKICPKKAIKMKADKEGFLYPNIDKSKCINCGICLKECAFYKAKKEQSKSNKGVYIAEHKNEKVRMNSRSGGVFVACSDWILSNNGVVYGCILNKDMDIIHIRAKNSKERNEMCKSKYAQSDITNIVTRVEEDLQKGKKVLFTGTGCQVDAILNYLRVRKVSSNNLYTMDLICHGVVSPLIFKNYIKWLEKRYKGKIDKFEFRDKSKNGWKGHKESAVINGKKHELGIYRNIFYSNLCIRPSCYNCKYTKVNRNSDITFGDAWGTAEAMLNFDNKGTSVVIIQNEKGMELLEAIRKDCKVKEVELEHFMQSNLQKSSSPKGNREQFWKTYERGKIDAIIKKYGETSLINKIKAYLKRKLK